MIEASVLTKFINPQNQIMMKTFCLTTMIAVFLLLSTNGIQAQTTQKKLNQVELMHQLIGKWQAPVGKDTIEIWDCQKIGNALIINVDQVIKGKRTPLYVNNLGFDSKADKFKGYALFSDGTYATWIGSYSTDKNSSFDIVHDFNANEIYTKFESVINNSKEWTWTSLNKEGVKISEMKFVKVK